MFFAKSGPRSLERQLQLAYIAAFAVVIAAFAFASRLSFQQSLQTQAASRLETLARAGAAAVSFTPRSFVVDAQSLGGFTISGENEGVQWFDVNHQLVAQQGLSAPGKPELGWHVIRGAGATVQSYTIELKTAAHQLRGYVRAMQSDRALAASQRPLDIALLVGALIATLAAAAGGRFLARAAVSRTEETLRRLSEFTADAAHELRGPLTALGTTASAALREASNLPDVTRMRLVAIAELGSQMRRLADDLLVLTRAGQSLERELFVVDLHVVLERLCERFAAIADEKGVRLQAESTAVQVYGNEDQIERIVANLVDNAIRYTDRGGVVEMKCWVEAPFACVSVRDTGVGIAVQHHEKIFERFWRVDEARASAGAGAGLGLAIVRALLDRHGGDITVASSLGNGSTFIVRLPLRPPSL